MWYVLARVFYPFAVAARRAAPPSDSGEESLSPTSGHGLRWLLVVAALVGLVLAVGGGYALGHRAGVDWGKATLMPELEQFRQQLEEYRQQLDAYRDREGNKKRVVFLRGLDSSSGQSDDPFALMKQRLQQQGYTDRDFTDYSYSGGSINGLREFFPILYGCEATRAALADSAGRVRTFVRTLLEQRPGGDVALVGFSLGGRIALQALGSQPVPVEVAGVRRDTQVQLVTIASPLRGVHASKTWVVQSLGGCVGGGAPVFNDLAAYRIWQEQDPNVVLNVANPNDCLYVPTVCGGPGILFPDEADTQVVPGAAHYWAQTPRLSGIANVEKSHQQVLHDLGTVQRIADFLGSQQPLHPRP